MVVVLAVVKLGDRHAQVVEKKWGERTSVAPRQEEVVDVESILELVVPVEKVSKRKEITEVAPRKLRKKIRTISLSKKKNEEYVLIFMCSH